MSEQRPKRESMSIEEATISNMWEMAALVEVFERKELCTSKTSTTSSLSFAARIPVRVFLRPRSLNRTYSRKPRIRSLTIFSPY